MFTIKNQEEFNECLMWISDLSKDAYGFRIRNRDWDSMSFEELADEVNFYSDIVEREELYRDKKEEDDIQKCLDAGAPDVETAKRWLEDAMWG
jgi:RNA processing factor Prp31